jgi:transcriptional regulator with XRE-family HTH domain
MDDPGADHDHDVTGGPGLRARVSRTNIAFWELSSKPPRSDVLPKLAKVLGVRVEELLGDPGLAPPRRPGPVGKLQRAFELASSLPRKQQELVTRFVETLAEQQRRASEQPTAR